MCLWEEPLGYRDPTHYLSRADRIGPAAENTGADRAEPAAENTGASRAEEFRRRRG